MKKVKTKKTNYIPSGKEDKNNNSNNFAILTTAPSFLQRTEELEKGCGEYISTLSGIRCGNKIYRRFCNKCKQKIKELRTEIRKTVVEELPGCECLECVLIRKLNNIIRRNF